MKEIKNQKERHFARKEKVLGQFMTPPEVADFMVDFALSSLDRDAKLAIDPACGDGIFLRSLIENKIGRVVGVDIDEKIIPEDLKNKCEIIAPRDGLLPLDKGLEGHADIVVGNPPFSAKYGRVNDKKILSRFELGKEERSQAIEILFLERFIQLASDFSVVGIILPSGIFSNIPLQYVRKFICNNTSILGIISLPRGIFRGTKNTTSKTNILFVKKRAKNSENVFMGVVNKLEDFPLILESYQQKREIHNPPAFWAKLNTDILSPEFYFTPIHLVGQKVIKLKDLISEMFCGKTEYGPKRRFATQGIRFISAKTVTPLGIDFSKEDRGRHFVDPKSEMYKQKAHVRAGDLLFVRVGIGCIGRAAVVTKKEEQGVADDWIYIIRPKKESLSYYLAFYLQSKYGISQVNMFKRGVGTVTIPQRLLKNLVVSVPSETQLQKFKECYIEMVKWRQKDKDKARKIFQKAIEMAEKYQEKDNKIENSNS